ncbi:hypothetical protein [Metabacillus malikii]
MDDYNQKWMYDGYYYRELNQSVRPSIVVSKHGDVTGDGVVDLVYLTAIKTPDSPFWRNITLVIINGRTQKQTHIQLKNNQGYNPTLFLGDVTGNKVNDILIISDTGGSGGAINAAVYSYINGRFQEIFNDSSFQSAFTYDVAYEQHYKASVISHKVNEKFVIDLTYKGQQYLSEIYTRDGKLIEPITGWVNPLSGLYPIDFNRDGTYELEAYQRIAGRYNADSLGYVQTVLRWNGSQFVPERQYVAIYGGEG